MVFPVPYKNRGIYETTIKPIRKPIGSRRGKALDQANTKKGWSVWFVSTNHRDVQLPNGNWTTIYQFLDTYHNLSMARQGWLFEAENQVTWKEYEYHYHYARHRTWRVRRNVRRIHESLFYLDNEMRKNPKDLSISIWHGSKPMKSHGWRRFNPFHPIILPITLLCPLWVGFMLWILHTLKLFVP